MDEELIDLLLKKSAAHNAVIAAINAYDTNICSPLDAFFESLEQSGYKLIEIDEN